MHFYLRCSVAIIAMALNSVPVHSQQSPDDKVELMRLEKVWNDAYLHGDANTLDQLFADDLVVTMSAMRLLDKKDSVGIIRSGRVKFRRYETSELRIQVYGDAAVVTGLLERVRDVADQNVEDQYRFTKVYVRKSSKWLVVAWHASIP